MHTWLWRGHHNVAYETYGSGDIPVVLVHGMGACHEHWNKLIPELRSQYRVYALDLLGFGAWTTFSPRAEAPVYTVNEDCMHCLLMMVHAP